MDIPFGIGDQILSAIILLILAYKFCTFYLFLTIFIVIISAWIFRKYHEKQYWHKIGIPGPNVNIIFGGMLDFLRRGSIPIDEEMFAKYGNYYGSFIFGKRELCTKDPEILRRILIKDFSYFQNRISLMPKMKKGSKSLFQNVITNLRDDDWKRVRNRVTPAFTTGKLKKLIPILCESTNRFCDIVEKDYVETNKELPLKDLFGRLVLDEIGRAGFSLNLNTFEDDKSEFLKHTRTIFDRKGRMKLMALLVFCPFISFLYEKLVGREIFWSPATKFYEDMMQNLYEQRRADPEAKEKYADIFQILMNAVEEDEPLIGQSDTVTTEDAEIVHKELASGNYGKHLTPIELFAQSFVLLVAGFDTTGWTLAYAAHSLAMDQEIQEKLRDEILGVMGEEKMLTYEHVRRMHYLQAVVQETLRMYPIAPKLNRECTMDCVINGIPFHKGDVVTIPIYIVQHDEQNFAEPEKFDPER